MKFLKMNWLYFRAVTRHRWYVMIECFKAGLIWQGLVHDLSKYTPAEWGPYARYFYGGKMVRRKDGTLIPDPEFDTAWNHHQKTNPHHWQYWLLTRDTGETVALPMPDRFWREMLCDWKGAGMAYGNPDTRAWYIKNIRNITLHPFTRASVDLALGLRDPDADGNVRVEWDEW
jgi:hypothetical protein